MAEAEALRVKQQRRTWRSVAVCLLALGVLTTADLWSKAWAVDTLSRPLPSSVTRAVCAPDADGYTTMQRMRAAPQVIVPGHLQLRYAENCGAAFGMLDGAPRWIRATLFTAAAVIAVFVLLAMYVRGSGGPLFAVAVPLITSGALGNLVDRVRYGYVIDFIRYHGLFEWPTFNIADATITVGVVLLFLDGLGAPKESSVKAARAETAET